MNVTDEKIESDKPRRWQFQFSLGRLLACMTFVALAAWVATIGQLPVKLSVEQLQQFDLVPIFACFMLLCAALGVLIKGDEGALRGCQLGYLLPCLAMIPISLWMLLKQHTASRIAAIVVFGTLIAAAIFSWFHERRQTR